MKPFLLTCIAAIEHLDLDPIFGHAFLCPARSHWLRCLHILSYWSFFLPTKQRARSSWFFGSGIQFLALSFFWFFFSGLLASFFVDAEDVEIEGFDNSLQSSRIFSLFFKTRFFPFCVFIHLSLSVRVRVTRGI